jgi:predicted aspartyl protease
MRLFPTLLVLLLAACAGLTGEAPPSCGPAAGFNLPVQPSGPFIAVPATINGRPKLFVVDTGAGTTILSEAAAGDSGVATDPRRVLRAQGIAGPADYATANVDHLVIGGVPVDPASLTVMPQVPVADGNLGMDILGDVDLDIDMADHRITLHRGQLCPRALPPWDRPATELVTRAEMSRLLPATARPRLVLVEIAVNGVTARALIDTGSVHSVVAKAFAARLGVDDAALAARPRIRLLGLSQQSAEGWLWRFRDVRIGSEQFNGPQMIVADLHDAAFDVVLGIDYLADHRVWISYRGRRVFVLRS